MDLAQASGDMDEVPYLPLEQVCITRVGEFDSMGIWLLLHSMKDCKYVAKKISLGFLCISNISYSKYASKIIGPSKPKGPFKPLLNNCNFVSHALH